MICLKATKLESPELEMAELELQFHYAQIKELYVYKDHKIMLTNKIKVVLICPHIRSIKVLVTEQELLCHVDNLYCHGVLHLKYYENDIYLIEKDNWIKPLLYV